MRASPIRRLDTSAADFESSFEQLTARHEERDTDLAGRVTAIIDKVVAQRDAAVLALTQTYDQHPAMSMADLSFGPEDCQAAFASLAPETRHALEAAADRIRAYHEHQLADSWAFDDAMGNRLGQRVMPMTRVGIYVPGGKASYPSSVLMNALPAKVAGVSEIIMTAPAPGGELSPLVLAAAHLAGVDRVFNIGGAQAVAALAYGTESIPAVDKIVGPGNRYVAEAKRQVFGKVGIDMVAGPSEILVIADESADPHWVAMDLFSQAEHDEQAQAILISSSDACLNAVEAAIEDALPTMEREAIIRASLNNRGALIKVQSTEEALAVSNRVGPEHLELALQDADQWLERVTVAGAIFVGHHSCESLGDYCAGPNHVLPTTGTARFSSPLGVYDFQRRSSVIQCSPQGASTLGQVASVLARGESLTAHARSAEYRINSD